MSESNPLCILVEAQKSTPMEKMTNWRPMAAVIRGMPGEERKSKSRTKCGRGDTTKGVGCV